MPATKMRIVTTPGKPVLVAVNQASMAVATYVKVCINEMCSYWYAYSKVIIVLFPLLSWHQLDHVSVYLEGLILPMDDLKTTVAFSTRNCWRFGCQILIENQYNFVYYSSSCVLVNRIKSVQHILDIYGIHWYEKDWQYNMAVLCRAWLQ